MQIKYLQRTKGKHGRKLFLILFGLSVAHFAEILIFAVSLHITSEFGFGGLEGALGNALNFEDYFYFSAATYSTLGIGDIFPTGHLRVLTGVEAVVGLMLIAWSATFFYFHMEQRWLGFKGR